jgi:hypothetical protein
MNYKRITILVEEMTGDCAYLLEKDTRVWLKFWHGPEFSIRIEDVSDADLHPWKIIKQHLKDIWIEVRSLLRGGW